LQHRKVIFSFFREIGHESSAASPAAPPTRHDANHDPFSAMPCAGQFGYAL
jgi:hypothetical protein